MTPVEELRAAAAKLRAERPYGEIDEPLAVLLGEAADLYDWTLNDVSGQYRDRIEPNTRAMVKQELTIARVINGGER